MFSPNNALLLTLAWLCSRDTTKTFCLQNICLHRWYMLFCYPAKLRLCCYAYSLQMSAWIPSTFLLGIVRVTISRKQLSQKLNQNGRRQWPIAACDMQHGNSPTCNRGLRTKYSRNESTWACFVMATGRLTRDAVNPWWQKLCSYYCLTSTLLRNISSDGQLLWVSREFIQHLVQNSDVFVCESRALICSDSSAPALAHQKKQDKRKVLKLYVKNGY